MARGKKVFSEEDKILIKSKLKDECMAFWVSPGYKETSIGALCKKAEISTGTFYNFYASKEELFFEVLYDIQDTIYENFIERIEQCPEKSGFETAIIQLYYEYESKPFLYDVKTVDFTSFYSKLSEEMKEKLIFDSSELFRTAIKRANLKLKVSENLAFSTFSVLLSSVASKEGISKNCDHLAAFQFMTKQLVASIFE
ncbi:TetR/AcrR family transcriptional regulator [Lysinibacillus sp. BPa_S21]|uniref:TetR/AcrR family transcriptional regulator n=1 Tax=Lysinibacillus sp. BPa_S21 TaxID=2932478 RepID=UPI0020110D83|nr:TetR/AcrR family transcriptional regulator [Lysinibacillus sp. BPa_S21]MCL1694609.1 TetR/AcrR family transcriptional regulator [Lysinibacillus sp. BPa_S21]